MGQQVHYHLYAAIFPICFTKALEVYDFPLPQELDGFTDIGLLNQAKNVVVSGSCFLLCDTFKSTNRVKAGEERLQKLKNSVLDKLLQSHLTKAELDFLIELSHYQDNLGKVHGVYYRSMCKVTGMSYQTFYVTMLSLADKGVICYEKAYYGDWDITILDNDFSYPEAVKEGYISTGHDIFYDEAFKELKANEKLLAMQFLKIGGAGKRYHIGVELFYEKYAELLRVAKRTIQVYLGRLKAFFSIGIKDKMYWITPLQKVFKDRAPKDIQNFAAHLGRVALRRNKAVYTEESLRDTLELVKQYAQSFKEETAKIFLGAVAGSIAKTNETVRDKRKWDRNLKPKFIHKLMRSSM